MITRFDLPWIQAICVAIPSFKQDLLKLNFDARDIKRIIKLTGIEHTRIAPSDMTAADYCIEASEKLFQEMSTDRNEIDGLVFVSAYPDYVQPGTCGVIQNRLHLSKKIIAMDINHACTAFIYGIFEAYLLIQTGMCQNVLVCTGDTPTRFINPRDRSMQMISSDSGAAALVSVGQLSQCTTFSFHHDGSGVQSLGILAGGNRIPIQKGVTDREEMDGNGNFHSLENLNMDGMAVMNFAMHQVQHQVNDILESMEWEKNQVDVFGFHQANKMMVRNLARQMNLSMEHVPLYVQDVGNLGPESIPAALCSQKEKSKMWNRAVLCAFGSGLSCAAIGIDLSKTKFLNIQEV